MAKRARSLEAAKESVRDVDLALIEISKKLEKLFHELENSAVHLEVDFRNKEITKEDRDKMLKEINYFDIRLTELLNIVGWPH